MDRSGAKKARASVWQALPRERLMAHVFTITPVLKLALSRPSMLWSNWWDAQQAHPAMAILWLKALPCAAVRLAQQAVIAPVHGAIRRKVETCPALWCAAVGQRVGTAIGKVIVADRAGMTRSK